MFYVLSRRRLISTIAAKGPLHCQGIEPMRLRLLTALCGLTILAAVPAPAQTLHIALREDPDILDPTLARSYVGRIAFAGLCDKLFDTDENLGRAPELTLGYE